MEFCSQSTATEGMSMSTPSGEAVSTVAPDQKKPLVVRVKRKRNQESIDAICIEEHHPASKKRGMAGLAAGFNSMSHVDSTKVLLTRIETITENVNNSTTNDNTQGGLDTSTYNALKRSRGSDQVPSDNQESVPKKNRDSFKLIVTKNKKIFTNKEENSSDSMIFVDMTSVESTSLRQEKEPSRSNTSTASGNKSSGSAKKGTRVLDPITRMLDASIQSALATGDFTDMVNAIDQGADINYQRTQSDGYTCLMAAVQKSNLKVVSKILCKNANVLVQNEVTQTAVDIAEYAKIENKCHSASMILIMVRDKASEQYLQLQKSHRDVDDQDSDYVYDIYTCSQTQAESTTTNSDNRDDTSNTHNTNIYDSVPNVKVSGLSLDDMGNAEIDFHYDSDWSDLAQDDDDADSNDENYFGNDYPEDEDAGSNDGYERNFESMISKSDDDDDSDDDGGRLPRFDRTGIGRQLKPFVVDEHQSSFGKTSEEIENLWSLEDRAGEDGLMGPEGEQHATRLNDMGKRTGMHVGALPREFDSNGLPKYGMELSDDEGEVHYGNYDDYEQYNNEAYDSEESY